MKRLIICMMLSLAMVITFIPMIAFAEDVETDDQVSESDVQVEEQDPQSKFFKEEIKTEETDIEDDSEEPVVKAKAVTEITSINLTIKSPVCGTFIQDNANVEGPQPEVTIPAGSNYLLPKYGDYYSAWWYSYIDNSYEFVVKGGNTYTAEIALQAKDDSMVFAVDEEDCVFNIQGGKLVSYYSDPDEDYTYCYLGIEVPAVHNYSHVIYGTGYLTNGVECDKCIGCGAEVNGRVAGGWSTRYVKSAKVKKGKGSLTVKWKKQSKKNQKKFDGYEIRYSTINNINTAKAITVGKSKKSKKIGKLAKKTKYYVWICSYKKVNGVKNYSNWKWGTVKTK